MLGRAQIAAAVRRKTGKQIPLATRSRLRSLRFAEDLPETEDEISSGFSFNLPAKDQADHLRALTPVTKNTFDGLTSQYKRDAFTVAGAADVRLIEKIRDQLAAVLEKGGTRQDFEKAVAQLTTDAGVESIAAFTLDTVFQTNMAKAYALGRYEQMTDPDVAEALPFWQYMTVGDDRVRPEHAALDGFAARIQDPVWRKIYPPNGFNCRCIAIALLEEEADALDTSIHGDPNEPGLSRLSLLAREKVPQPGFGKVFA